MYAYEERLRAVALYTKLGKRLKAVIRQLGYPTKNSLRARHEDFQKSGDVHASYVRRKPKYSDERKSVAFLSNIPVRPIATIAAIATTCPVASAGMSKASANRLAESARCRPTSPVRNLA